jgi:hypothetical protein
MTLIGLQDANNVNILVAYFEVEQSSVTNYCCEVLLSLLLNRKGLNPNPAQHIP